MKTRDLSSSGKATGPADLGTSTWWFARLVLLQQHILDERCSSLFDMVQVLMNESLNLFGNVEKATCYWGALLEEEEASTIVSTLQLEAGFIECTFGRVDPARYYLLTFSAAFILYYIMPSRLCYLDFKLLVLTLTIFLTSNFYCGNLFF